MSGTILPKNIIKQLSSLQNLNQEDELEVRFGHFTIAGFIGSLPDKSLYFSIVEHLDNLCFRHPNEIERFVTCRTVEIDNNHIRRITVDQKTVFQAKTRLFNIDNTEWGYRISKSSEINVLPPSNFIPIIRRHCYRTSYIDTRPQSSFYGFRIDVSRILIDNNSTCEYELELELLDRQIPPITKWYLAINTLYGWMLSAVDSSQIISVKERLSVADQVARYLNINKLDRPNTLTDLSVIKGNAISLKIDGTYKLLVLTESGSYLYSPPFDIIKVSPRSSNVIPMEKITVIEGEFLPEKKIFFAFNLLILDGVLITQDFRCRYKLLSSLSDNISRYFNYEFKVKKFWFPEDNDYLQVFSEYESNNPNIDGIIFQPITVGKIWKWKPQDKLTIDFYIIRDQNLDNIPYIISKGQLIRYGQPIQIKSELNPDRKIFECKLSGRWEVIRERPDRTLPNTFETVKQILTAINAQINLHQIKEYLSS